MKGTHSVIQAENTCIEYNSHFALCVRTYVHIEKNSKPSGRSVLGLVLGLG